MPEETGKDLKDGDAEGAELNGAEFNFDDDDEYNVETMSIETFKNLDKKVIAKRRKVDWDAVLEDVLALRKPFTSTYLRKLAQKNSYRDGEKIHLHHSELMRVISKWDRDVTIVVIKRVRERDRRVFYHVYRGSPR